MQIAFTGQPAPYKRVGACQRTDGFLVFANWNATAEIGEKRAQPGAADD
jgi:hypothetical protein